MAGHAQLKFVMTECSKTQIRLTGLNYPQIPSLSVPLLLSGSFYAGLVSIAGSPWKVTITDPSKMSATGPGLDYIHVHRLTWFDVHTVSKPTGIDDLMVIIRGNIVHVLVM